MSIRIGFQSPGDLHLGRNSLVRGEFRVFIEQARVLSRYPEFDIYLIGQNNREYIEDNIKYVNLKACAGRRDLFDILFSRDPFKNIGIEENWITPYLEKLNIKHKIFAPFFGSEDHYKCTVPVVYPFFYREVNNKETFCLPVPFGKASELALVDNFDKRNAIWFSKNSHENPEYLYISLKRALEYVHKKDGRLIIIDGHKLIENEYKDSDRVKKLLIEYKDNVWWNKFGEWLPHDKMMLALSKSKFITGIHHPVCSPMQVEAPFYGAVPIIFQNQKELPPYDNTDIPFINFDEPEYCLDVIYDIIDDEHEYEEFLNKCKGTAVNYSDEMFMTKFNAFLNYLGVNYVSI